MTLIAHPPRREYSFTAAQIANPAAPPPGDKLDGEVDRIHRAIANIVDWVSVSLNSDGTLKAQPQSQQPPVTIAGADITALAEDWAFASADWAEHMPDTIPPNTLNIMAVTGDHWSARWWANRALEIVNESTGGLTTVISDTPPAPGIGKLWWDSVGGQLYLFYDDGNSGQWVPATNQPGPPGPAGPPGTGLSAPVQVAEGGTGVTSFPPPVGAAGQAYLLGNGAGPVTASPFWYAAAAEPYSIIGRTSVAEGWCPYIQMASSGGTIAAPAATPAGTPLGGIFVEGHVGTGWTNGAANLTFYAAADFSPGAQPTYADLYTSGGDFIFGANGDFTVPGTAILGTPLAITSGGTGAATAAAARTNLGAAPLASPVFTGNPIAPTPAPGDNDTSIATTAFVSASFAPLASPSLTGNPTAPTPAPGDSDTSIATTAFVTASFAPLNNPHLTGIPTAPTPSPGNSTTQLATTAFVAASIGASGGGTITGVTAGAGLSGGGTTGTVALALSSPVAIANGGTNAATAPAALANLGAAPLASPALTGNPTAPTPSPGDNDTSIATSAFVTAAITAAPNKTITLTGDVTGSGTAGIAAALASVNPNVGTFQGITVNAKGLVTGAGNQSYAPLASPNLTGTPTAPTPPAGTNTTQLATTAFVFGNYFPLAGVTNASNAAAGAVGEVIQAELTFATSLALTSAVWRNVVSITLTPGDWDVWGTIGFYSDIGNATISRQSGAISLTSGTADGPGPLGGGYFDLAANATPGGGGDFPVGRRRVNVATSTTVYLIGYAAFAVSTLWVYGGLYARRMR